MYLCTKIQESQQDMDEKKSLTVKEWASEDRPREKMLLHGKKELSNAELIAILLRSGIPGKNAVEVAKEILNLTNNSLTALSQFNFKRLASIRGLGSAKAATLLAALELGWRMQGEINSSKSITIANSTDLFNYMLPQVVDLDHEEFWAIYLSNSNKVISKQRIAMGGQTDTPVDIRILFRIALENKAIKLSVIHNHPSGNITPSNSDKQLTRHIIAAGELLNIKLVEHLIIGLKPDGRADYYSFHDNRLV